MITYPSTHGVFEASVGELCALVHDAGGQVYVDGANLNALVGHARPGRFGADVCHLNLHKTFCIPHGGGGPGIGPIGVRGAPGAVPARAPAARRRQPRSAPVSAAPFGSAGILPIPWMYIEMMGGAGLTGHAGGDRRGQLHRRTARSVLPVLYTGEADGSRTSASSICGRFTKSTGVTVDDVAKRLMDYGFHAPDDELSGGRHADGRADRERVAARTRPVLRRDDRDPRRDRLAGGFSA
jgi:glycine dehydrogenase